MRLYGDLDWIAPPPEVVSVVQQQFRQQHRPLPQRKPQRRRLDSIFVSRRMLAVAGALAVVTIVLMGYLLAVLLTQHPSLTATASQVAGLMEIQPAGDPNWKRLIVGSEIGQGDRIRAGIAGEAQIRLPDNSLIMVGDKAQLAFLQLAETDANGGQSVVVHQYIGIAEYNIEPQELGSSWFEVETSSAELKVVGTKFSVEVTDLQTTLVTVEEGLVEITGLETKIVAQNGQTVNVRPKSEPVIGQPTEVAPLECPKVSTETEPPSCQ
jgi:hypothetical protein